ncbi:MAG: DUF362 domain-containing protein [Elusimicrobiota bacterium]
MPWIDTKECTGCGICVEQCPVDAIFLDTGEIAEINMDECIRCGECHGICPREAVMHDSLKIPERVEENLKTAERLLKKCPSEDYKVSYLNKYIKSFNLTDKVNEQTIDKLKEFKKEFS